MHRSLLQRPARHIYYVGGEGDMGGSAAYRPFWVQMWLPCSLVMHQSVIKIREYYRMLCYQYQRQWHHLLNSVLCCSLFTIPHINSCAAPAFSWRANMAWKRPTEIIQQVGHSSHSPPRLFTVAFFLSLMLCSVDSTFIALTVAKLLGNSSYSFTRFLSAPLHTRCLHACTHLLHPAVILRVRLKTGQSENVLTINDISGAVTTLTLSFFTTNTNLANIYSWMYWCIIFYLYFI